MTVLIKRYANRKLYNTKASRYITLKGIAELIDDGEEVRVIDNETGEDITSIALSQILVDNERSSRGATGSVLSELFHKSGDALYGALRRGVDDAQEGISELQRNMRKLMPPSNGGRISDWIAYTSPDVDRVVQSAVERVFKMLDLPRRSDIEALNANLKRVASALEALDTPPRAPDDDT